jgi:hypothetical protein
VISFMTALRRSSNSPRYFVPAISAPMSSARALVLQEAPGTSPRRCAGRALDDGGLADARLADEHRVVLGAAREHLHDARISSSRPMTGSSLPRCQLMGIDAPRWMALL